MLAGATIGPRPAARSLADRIFGTRDRLLASERFRDWASGFWLTRPIARRRARALFDLCAGFTYSQVLAACVRLRVFDFLAEDGPATVAAIAGRTALPLESAHRLLRAAAALRLVARRGGGRYGLGPLGAALVGNPGLRAMIEHHAMLYSDLADPVALLRAERPDTVLARYWAYGVADRPDTAPPESVAAYSSLMAATQPLIAREVLEAYPVGRHRCLLDVGGGEGVFLAAAAEAGPLRLMLFDLPAVAERARARLEQRGLGDRVTVAAGDFRRDALPAGADLCSVVRILHDHDDATVRRLLASVARALPPGGSLLIAEPLAGTPGAEPLEAYFALYLLAMGRGRLRTEQELGALLRSAGFDRVRRIPTRTPLLTSVLIARRTETDPPSVNSA